MKIIRKFIALYQLRKATKRAFMAYLKNNHRYFVMPSAGLDGELIILDRNNFCKLRDCGYIDKDISVRDLMNRSFFYTPKANGKDALPEFGAKAKTKSFLIWKERTRLKKKLFEKKQK